MYMPEMIRPDRYGPSANPQQGQFLIENLLKFGTTFGATIVGQTADIMDKDVEITGLGEDISSLQSQITTLTADKTSLTGKVSTLTSEKASLQSDLTAAQSSASTMQLAAVAALVIGVVVGYFVGPMIKKK